MRFLIFMMTGLSCASAQAIELPSCENLQTGLRALPLTAADLADHIALGEITAKQCVWEDSSLRCSRVRGADWTVEEIIFHEVETSYTRLKTLRVTSLRAEWSAGGWLLQDLEFEGFQIAEARVSQSCEFHAIVGEQVEVELADRDKLRGVTVADLPTFATQAGRSSGGFLPPVVRYSDMVEFAASGFITGTLGVGVNLAPTHWYGAHVVAASDDARILEVGANAADLSTLEPYVVGDLVLGNRLSAAAEWGDPRALQLRLLDTGAFSRGDQRTRAGASGRGAGHELSTSVEEYEIPGAQRFRRAKIRFGADESLGDVVLKTDVEHESRWMSRLLDDRSASVHSALVALRAEVPLAGSGWAVSPALDMNMSFGVVPTDDGFEASTTASVVPNLLLRTHVVGRFNGWVHRLGLNTRGGVEVYGFSQREPLPPRVPDYLFVREPSGYFWGSALEQSIEIADWRVAVPVGALVQKQAGQASLTPWTSLSVQGHSRLALEATLICVDACSDAHVLSSGELALGRWSLFGAAGDGVFGRADAYIFGGPAAVGAPLLHDDKGFNALLGSRVSLGRYVAAARTFAGVHRSGVDASLAWSPGLGWNIGLGGGVDFQTGDVAFTAGLTHRH